MKQIYSSEEVETGMIVVFQAKPERLFTVIAYENSVDCHIMTIDDTGRPHILMNVSIFALWIPIRNN